MENKPTLYVCITCNLDGIEREGGAGHKLHEKANQELAHLAHVAPIKCLGGCEKACSIAVTAPNKSALVFTGLNTASIPDLAEYLRQYTVSPTGIVAKADRPASLRENVLSRVPAPLGSE